MARSHWHSFILHGAVASALALGVPALPMGPVRAEAQETATLRGVVADEATGRLVRSATVTLVGTDRTVKTDADGTFVFPAAPLGRTLVRVRADEYPAMVEEIVIVEGTGNVLPVFLQSQAAALEGILVLGHPTQALDKTAKTAADLLAHKYPEIAPFVTSTHPKWPARLLLRGRNTMGTGQGGEPIIVVDGVRMMGGIGFAIDVLKQISASDIKKLDILEGPSAAFLYGAADGAIIVETQAGEPR